MTGRFRFTRGLVLTSALCLGACSHHEAAAKDRTSADQSSAASTPVTPAPAAFMLSEAQRQRIHLQTITAATFHPTIQTTGTVAFNGDHSTPVISAISGPVSRILVNIGAQVKAGDPLALVTSPDFAAAVASYQKAQTALANATRIATLDAQLFKNDALSRSDLEQARSDSASAAADREAAVQQMVSLGVDSSTINAIREGKAVTVPQGVIRAPIEGVVVEKLINPGQLLSGGSTQAFTIADLSTVWVMANIFESDLGDVSAGQSAQITTAASPDTFPGHVDYVGAIVDPNTRATAVRIVVQNHRDLLKRDMYVDIAIHSTHARSGILAPVSAVLRDEENLPFVFVAASNGGFDRRPITLGTRAGDQYEVTKGLAAGDQVVTEGALFLQFAESQ